MPQNNKGASKAADKQQHENIDLLLVSIGGERVFMRSAEIKEVLRPSELTPVPMGPSHVIGLSNVRGQVFCIIDAGGITSLSTCHRAVTPRTRFLLLRHAVMHVGIWVDEVCKMQPVDRSVLANVDDNGDSVCQIDIKGVEHSLLQCSALLH